jgi:mRNA-degrading endonuclease RelE of RelBE toxin-antitoxin system
LRNFRLQLTKSAARDVDGISDDQREKILKDMRILASGPPLSQANIKKLKGFRPPLYRLRSGDYRILYQVLGDIVTVMRVISRKDLDKIVKRIKL